MPKMDFGTAEAWEAGDKLLPAGEHVVEIMEAETGTSSGGHPQIEVKLSNHDGGLRDWIVITPKSLGRAVALFDASGMSRPNAEQSDTDSHAWTVYIDTLVGKKVGIAVREEPDYKDPTQTRLRIAGYKLARDVQVPSDIPSDIPAQRGPGPADDVLPF